MSKITNISVQFFLLTVVFFLILSLLVFSDTLLLSGTSYSIIVLGYVILFFRFYSKKKIDLFSPPVLFTLAFFLYSLGGGLFAEFRHTDRGGYPLSVFSISRFYFLCLLALGFYLQGVLFGQYKKIKSKVSFSLKRFNPYSLIAFSLVVGLPFLRQLIARFNFFNAKTYKDVLDIKLAFRATDTQGLVDVIFVLGPMFCILFSLSYLFLNRKSGLLIRILSFTLFMAPMITYFIEGQRSEMVSLLVIPIMLYHFKFRSISLKPRSLVILFLFGTMFFFGMKAIEVVRGKEKVADKIPFLVQEFDKRGWELFSLSNVGELLTSANQIVLIEAVENGQIGYSYGGTFLSDIFAFVPRVIWPNRPLPLSEFYVYTFYHDIWRRGGGLGLFITMESFWAFGYLGTVVYFFLFGLFSQLAYRFLTKEANLFALMIYIKFFEVFIVSSTRSGILLGIKGLFMGIFTVLAYMLFIKLLTKSKTGQTRLNIDY